MGDSKSNMLLILFVVIVIIAIIYYINKNNQPIQNEGTISNIGNNILQNHSQVGSNGNADLSGSVNRPTLNNRATNDISDNVLDDLISQYNNKYIPSDDHTGTFSASDPMSNNHGTFSDYGTKNHLNFKQMEQPYSDSDCDPRDFSYKKKKFTKRTHEDVQDLFNVSKMLPQEIEEDWFDIGPLQNTKQIKGTHLIHPKVHMGVNTIGSSLKNATHDIRGDIPNPKIKVSPFLNSTIEPDNNIKGLCN